jgi:hypothetical protein
LAEAVGVNNQTIEPIAMTLKRAGEGENEAQSQKYSVEAG